MEDVLSRKVSNKDYNVIKEVEEGCITVISIVTPTCYDQVNETIKKTISLQRILMKH